MPRAVHEDRGREYTKVASQGFPQMGLLAPGHHRCFSTCHDALEKVSDSFTFSCLPGAQMRARHSSRRLLPSPGAACHQQPSRFGHQRGHLCVLACRVTGSQSLLHHPHPSTALSIRAPDTITFSLYPRPPPKSPRTATSCRPRTHQEHFCPSAFLHCWFPLVLAAPPPPGYSNVRPERLTLLRR